MLERRPELFTSSRLKVLRRCLREHYYRYVLGIRTPETGVMRFGTLGHRALEAWYRAWQRGGDRLMAALVEVDRVDDAVERAKLRLLVTAYHERWGAEPWEVLAVEVEFRYQLGDYLIAGKIDAIIRNTATGLTYIVEHKTTGQDVSTGTVYWERLAIDTQVSVYVDGGTVLGHNIAGCVYDVLVRPKHERKLATPEAEREYTKGRGCKECGGSGGGKRGVERGRGRITVKAPDGSVLRDEDCAACAATPGWSEAPRLVARHRAEDETFAEFTERLGEEIAADPDSYLKRSIVVRLADELPKMRFDLVDAIKVERLATERELMPRNPDACVRGRDAMCSYFGACAGTADIDNTVLFPRGPVHAELAHNP